MFVLISTLISLCIIAIIYRYSYRHNHKLERRYQLIVHLRDLVNLVQRHRSGSHYSLAFDQKKIKQLRKVEQAIEVHCLALVQLSHINNKPMYRVLHNNLALMMRSWKHSSVNKNQVVHGKMVRHLLLLIDDLMVAWLIDLEKEELEKDYSARWHGVIDCLDCLTQLRMCIQKSDTTLGRQQLLHYCQLMHKKLHRLSVAHSHSLAPLPIYSAAMQDLDAVLASSMEIIDKENMYQLSSAVSDSILNIYDELIGELAETLYQPLPKLAVI
ncbi:hypothetical protein [Vibrio methylphosphonaticus]|uniref:hypothetical protein n=1 Tax=Vibrio methylphosphonaticus TaxID=2946866 RepID=UPI00202A6A08|nr:hypothetical protein [Vibrio methylphosphonaticus]MCL9774568.1 hypothetical protein [Vibrio methylphosphonaticus]